jgi:hypothetical protein
MTSTIPTGPARAPDYALVMTRAAALARDAAARWFTTDTVTAIG